MIKPNISPNFTIDDIHKVPEYNYEMTKNMTSEERTSYYSSCPAFKIRIYYKINYTINTCTYKNKNHSC